MIKELLQILLALGIIAIGNAIMLLPAILIVYYIFG